MQFKLREVNQTKGKINTISQLEKETPHVRVSLGKYYLVSSVSFQLDTQSVYPVTVLVTKKKTNQWKKERKKERKKETNKQTKGTTTHLATHSHTLSE